MTASDCNKNVQSYKIYQAMFRVIKESENVDERQHCFLVQTAGQESRYFSMETRQDLLKVESAWHRAVCQTVSQMGVSDTFLMSNPSSRIFKSVFWCSTITIYFFLFCNSYLCYSSILIDKNSCNLISEYNFSRGVQKYTRSFNVTLDRRISSETFCVPYLCIQL